MKKIVKILPVNNKNELFLHLRDNKGGIAYPNFWAEIGGEVDENETPIEALTREIKEEISCNIQDIEKIGELFEPKNVLNPEACQIIYFNGKINALLNEIQIFEGQKAGFFKLEDLETIKIPEILKSFIYKNKTKIFI